MQSFIKYIFFSLISIVCLSNCGSNNSDTKSEGTKDPLAGYVPKKIEYTGSSYKEFNSALLKTVEEYRTEITDAVNAENWALVQRELTDYWQLLDNLTPHQTGDIWKNERYQNAYDNFAAQIIIQEAKVLLDKQDDKADETLLETIISVKSLRWSTIDKGEYSRSDEESLMDKITPAIINLAKLKGRSKVIEFFD